MVNALVGGTLGQERTVLPLLADSVFHVSAYTAALVYIAAFGIVKAATNYLAGSLSDSYGRKPVLVAGWLIGLPVPLLGRVPSPPVRLDLVPWRGHRTRPAPGDGS